MSTVQAKAGVGCGEFLRIAPITNNAVHAVYRILRADLWFKDCDISKGWVKDGRPAECVDD